LARPYKTLQNFTKLYKLYTSLKKKTYIIEDCIVSSLEGMFYGAVIGFVLASLITVVFGEINV
jgi:hypothetical protein